MTHDCQIRTAAEKAGHSHLSTRPAASSARSATPGKQGGALLADLRPAGAVPSTWNAYHISTLLQLRPQASDRRAEFHLRL
jgi:hypothetical protein